MAQRRYGPTRGAGVAIIELEGDKTLSPGALGWVGHAGMYEKGPVGEMVLASNKTAFSKKFGGYIPDSQAPDAAIDYYDVANGAGGIAVVRVTDGNELPSSFALYARIAGVLTQVGRLDAANGGRWGGKEAYHTADFALAGDLDEITLDTGVLTWKVDQWKGAYLWFEAVPNKRYPVTGNTAGGVITVAADSKMKTDWGAGPSMRYYLALDNANDISPRGGRKALSARVRDGEDNPSAEWALDVFVDGVLAKPYPNLSMDSASSNYWVNVINNDTSNDEVFAVDLLNGAPTAEKRPANHYGVSSALTATLLTAVIHEFLVNSPGGGDPTFALGTTTDDMLAQVITLTMTSATAFNAVSDRFGALGSGVLGTLFTPNNAWTPPFTATAGGTPLTAADTLVVTYKPFKADSLVGGKVYPDKANAKRLSFRITANTHKTITAAPGSDMTAAATILAGEEFLVEAALEFAGGRDGHSAITDATWQQKAWDTGLSPFNRTDGKNLGLVKFATPGVTSTAVQKAGNAYATAKNHQYRYEVPSNILTEQAAMEYVDDTLGRSDFIAVDFPSYGYVADPQAITPGKLKLTTLTGQIHGREARTAVDYDGYHKAAAGTDHVLPKVLKLPTGEAQLNEELLNPDGINVIKKLHGNFVIWGDRTLFLDPTWKWKHQREQMSYYEHVLQENFDWIVFAINDPVSQKIVLAALRAFFLPEFTKRALRGKTFEDACVLKIDAENNTNLTMANGDLNGKILLRLADTVERLVLSIGKQGLFEGTA